jgi:hypothetical protein
MKSFQIIKECSQKKVISCSRDAVFTTHPDRRSLFDLSHGDSKMNRREHVSACRCLDGVPTTGLSSWRRVEKIANNTTY